MTVYMYIYFAVELYAYAHMHAYIMRIDEYLQQKNYF